jgi:hypothetical protein
MIPLMQTNKLSMFGLLSWGLLFYSCSPNSQTLNPKSPSRGLATCPATRPATRLATRPVSFGKKDLRRIAFIGASVSDGFGNGLPPSLLAKRVLKGRGFTVLRFTNSLFFLQPLKLGPTLMRRALRAKPTLLVGIDFLFWFGYGWMGDEARVSRLEKGLALLDRFSGKMLIGNLPDMQGADPKMLAKGQIPSTASLKELNARIQQWAKQRSRVRLFDLESHVKQMKTKGIVLPRQGKKVKARILSPQELMSWDRLHPSKKGVHYLLHLVFESLSQWGGSDLKASLAWDYVRALKQ